MTSNKVHSTIDEPNLRKFTLYDTSSALIGYILRRGVLNLWLEANEH